MFYARPRRTTEVTNNTREKWLSAMGLPTMTSRVQKGQYRPRGVGSRDHGVLTQGDKRHRCVCGVSSTAFKAHRRPKKHSSPGVPRNRHSFYRCFLLVLGEGLKQLPVDISSSPPSQTRKLIKAETTPPSGFHATSL